MMTNTLCKSFQRLGFTAKNTLARSCSTNSSSVVRRYAPPICKNSILNAEPSFYEPKIIAFVRPSSLDLNLPNRPGSIGEISQFPTNPYLRIGEPPLMKRRQEDIVPNKTIDLPSTENIIEKHAVRMIVIRRRKMRRHKLKKLRKRMKFFWGKIKQKREMKKEKAFHALLLGKIRRAEAWDPKAYVQRHFDELDRVRLPNRYRGVEMPESQIREFLKKDEEKRAKKLNRPNKPRLTL